MQVVRVEGLLAREGQDISAFGACPRRDGPVAVDQRYASGTGSEVLLLVRICQCNVNGLHNLSLVARLPKSDRLPLRKWGSSEPLPHLHPLFETDCLPSLDLPGTGTGAATVIHCPQNEQNDGRSNDGYN